MLASKVLPRKFSPIPFFAIGLFFLTVSDAILSYVVPVYISDALKDAAVVGLVLSISSFFGLFLDLFVANRLSRKTFRFFVLWMIVVAFLFPSLFLFFPPNLLFFAVAMIVWSIYYEFREFSKYDFVHRYAKRPEHVFAWSILSSFQSTAYLVGPLLAVLLIDKFYDLPLMVSFFFIALSGVIFYIFNRTYIHKKTVPERPAESKPLFIELKILKTLTRRVWHLLLFTVALTLLDVVFWTTGILYAEHLRENNYLAGFLLVAYDVPAVYSGYITQRYFGHDRKKRNAFILGGIAGAFLIFVGLVTNIPTMLVLALFAATASGISAILLSAVFEDYVSRVQRTAPGEMAGLSLICANVAYSVGPIVLGLIAKYYGLNAPFVFAGALLVVTAILAYAVVPKKIRMPQKELTQELFEIAQSKR